MPRLIRPIFLNPRFGDKFQANARQITQLRYIEALFSTLIKTLIETLTLIEKLSKLIPYLGNIGRQKTWCFGSIFVKY